MGSDKQMEEIVVAGSAEDSGAIILAETVLDSNTIYDWKIQHTGLMKKLEDRFNKEVHIPIAKQPTTVKEKSTATMQTAVFPHCFLCNTLVFPFVQFWCCCLCNAPVVFGDCFYFGVIICATFLLFCSLF